MCVCVHIYIYIQGVYEYKETHLVTLVSLEVAVALGDVAPGPLFFNNQAPKKFKHFSG